MKLLADAKMYLRFARDLPGFLRRGLSLAEAEAIVRRRLAEREENFLRLVERGIFGVRKSPYRLLFEHAGCTPEDLRLSVRSRGLEGTLEALRSSGVYVTFDELRGRTPLVRDGLELRVRSHDFDNPYLSRHYTTESGGSTGAGTRVGIDLEFLASRGPQNLLFEHVHDFFGLPTVNYYGALPDHGLNSLLTRCRYGSIPRRWFTPVGRGEIQLAPSHRLANFWLPRLVRWTGVPVPLPETVPLDRVEVIARWMKETLAAEGRCVLRTHVSHAVRVCLAATERGWRLDGAIITLGGEPPTPAKTRIIEATGAKPLPGYHMSELGPIAWACGRPVDENDLHFLKDHLAVIQAERRVPGFDVEIRTFLFTTLLPTAPKLLLNYEGDDYGILETRACGCPWERYGLREHLRGIRSYRKLTGEGMTLVGSDMERLLDEVLPARFGGSPLDYQMVEEEDEQGLTRLAVVIDPSVPISDERLVVETVLEAIGRMEGFHRMAGAIWRQAGTVRVRREAPRWTDRGKLSPLRPKMANSRRSAAAGGTSA